MTYKNFVYNVFKNHIQLYLLNLNYKYCFELLSGIFLVLQYLTNLSITTHYISWFMDFFSFFFVLNISSSKALVLYDAEWLTARKRFYEELFYLRTNCWVPLFAIFCGILNIFLNCVLLLIFPEGWRTDLVFECPSTDLFNDIGLFISPHGLLQHFVGFFLIFFGISAILIPFINRSFKLAFKKLFFLCVILLELAGVLSLCSAFNKETIFDVWWTKYIPINYWYGDGVSLSVSYITLSFFLITVSYFLIALIFIYNICFKRSKILSFFATIRSCFLFLVSYFLLFPISWSFFYNASLLCSYDERLKLLVLESTVNASPHIWNGSIVFYAYTVNTFILLILFPVILFLINDQLLKVKFKNYWKLIIGLTISWCLLVFGTLFLWTILEYWIEVSLMTKFYLRIFYFLFCFILLFFCLIKYLILNVKLNAVSFNILIFFFLFFLVSFCTFSDPILEKYLAWQSISNCIEFDIIFNSRAVTLQAVILCKFIYFWPVLGFFHWYIWYFFKLKLNKVFVVIEFCLLIWSCLAGIIFAVRLIIKDIYIPFVFIDFNNKQIDTLSLVDIYWLNLSMANYFYIYIGFIWLFLTIFVTYLYNNWRYYYYLDCNR